MIVRVNTDKTVALGAVRGVLMLEPSVLCIWLLSRIQDSRVGLSGCYGLAGWLLGRSGRVARVTMMCYTNYELLTLERIAYQYDNNRIAPTYMCKTLCLSIPINILFMYRGLDILLQRIEHIPFRVVKETSA